MKIAIVMPLGEQRGGGELMLLHLIQQGRDSGVDWLVIFLEDGPLVTQISDLGAEVRLVPGGRFRYFNQVVSAVTKIASILRNENVDVVFSWMAKAHLYSSPAAILAKKPAMWYQLGLPANSSRIDRIATWLPAKCIFACSQTSANAQAALSPRRPMQVVYPGVELERFDSSKLQSPTDTRKKLGLPLTGPLVGLAGRFQRWKGIHVLIDAMPAILKKHPDAVCVVVGGKHDLEPDYPSLVDSRIEAHGIKASVILTGMQSNVQEWMQAMDVVVHASDREPFGIVIIEAMALGKPVIAGDAGGPTEIITDGVQGLLTPYEDPLALSRAVNRYLDDPEFACEAGKRARIRAQDFSTKKYAQNFIAAVRSGLTKNH